jgi:branched-chain amino acid transport system permease protein
MDLTLFLQLIVNGLSVGALYVLVIVGLGLIIDTTRILNLSHGEFYMFGAYALYYVMAALGVNFAVAVAAAVLATAILGGICYILVFHRLRGNLLMSICASFGLSMVLAQVALLVFGRSGKSVPAVFSKLITFGELVVSLDRLVLIGISTLLVICLHYFIKSSKFGKAMRAVSLDAEAASLHGIDTSRIYFAVFALGCAIAGFAGGIIAPILAISTDMGSGIIFVALQVLIAGGVGSMVGAIWGGVIVGLLLSFGYQFIGGYSQLLLFVFVFVLLVFKPRGILGRIVHIE